jgi:endonuclease/exonuclease/phosphatase family metal-dependent hydrolase
MLIPTLVIAAQLAAPAAAPSPHHAYGLTRPMPRLDGTIRVASYNMLNYFDQVNDPSLEGKYDDFGTNPGPTSDARCRELAQAIRAIDADIIALQEVESKEALEWFNTTYLKDMGYRYVASQDVGYYRGCEQSLLSRFPISETRIWPQADLTKVKRFGGGWDEIPADAQPEQFAFQRSPLLATVQTPDGYALSLFILHHKAGRNRWRREAEALQIVNYLAAMQKQDPDRNILILGDFNAQPWDRAMQVYREGGMVDAMNLRQDLEHGYASPLRVTHTSGRVIDFILLNHAALGELVPGSGFVLGTSAQDYDWQNDPFPAGYASDHYPIAIDLVPREGQGATVSAAPWPRTATRTALGASPVKAADVRAPPQRTPPATPAGTGGFVASKRSQVFHTADCANGKRISETNRTAFKTAAAAQDAGKRPAKCCNPG